MCPFDQWVGVMGCGLRLSVRTSLVGGVAVEGGSRNTCRLECWADCPPRPVGRDLECIPVLRRPRSVCVLLLLGLCHPCGRRHWRLCVVALVLCLHPTSPVGSGAYLCASRIPLYEYGRMGF